MARPSPVPLAPKGSQARQPPPHPEPRRLWGQTLPGAKHLAAARTASQAQRQQSAGVPPTSRSLALQIIAYLTKIAAVTAAIGFFCDQREVAYKSQPAGCVWTPQGWVRNKGQIAQVWDLPGE